MFQDAQCCGAANQGRINQQAMLGVVELDIIPMAAPQIREVFIQGLTKDGQTFRPSDWAERLAGALSCFRPATGKQRGAGAYIGYSPYCVPRMINGVKCVIVNEDLRGIEPMAWDFAMNFARDNDLQVTEACLMPENGSPGPPRVD